MTDEFDSPVAQRVARADKVFTERDATWAPLFDEVYPLVIPERWRRWDDTKTPISLYDTIYDSTAIEAAQTLANQLVAGLVPPWVEWFSLAPGPDVSVEDREEIRVKLEPVNKVILQWLNTSNFTQEIQPAILESVIGTGCLRMQPHESGKGLEFKAIPMTELAISENSSGLIDHVYRRFMLAGREILRRDDWVKKITAVDNEMIEKMRKSPDEMIEIVETNEPTDKGKNEHSIIIREKKIELVFKTMDRNPYMTWRWNGVAGHAYGRGPGTIAFGDIRALNKAKEMTLKSMAFEMAGMWGLREGGTLNIRNLALKPGAVFPLRDPSNDLVRLNSTTNFSVAEFGIRDLRDSVRAAFLADQFSPVQGTKFTATEVMARSRIIAQNLGATFGRLQNELLIPMVTGMVDILIKQQELPAEIKLDRKELDVVFLSNLALAQRLQEVDDMVQFAQISAQLSQLDPTASLIIDMQKYQEEIADRFNINPELLRDSDEVDSITDKAVESLQQQPGGTPDETGQLAPAV